MLWLKVFNQVIENFEKLRSAGSTMNFETILSLSLCMILIDKSGGVQSSVLADYGWATKWQ